MTSCHYRGSFWLPWSCAVRGPVDPVDVPAVRLPGLSPCCPVQEGPPLLPVLQVSPSQLSPNWSSPNQEVAGVEQLQDLQADVRGRTEPGVGEDGRDDRTAVQVRGKRLLRARLSTQQTPAWDPLQVTKNLRTKTTKRQQQQQKKQKNKKNNNNNRKQQHQKTTTKITTTTKNNYNKDNNNNNDNKATINPQVSTGWV